MATLQREDDYAAAQMRKTKRFDENPERVLLAAGNKRAPLATVTNTAATMVDYSCLGTCSMYSCSTTGAW